MQPVQDCFCRAVIFQGFVATSFIAFKGYNREDIRQVSFLDNIMGS